MCGDRAADVDSRSGQPAAQRDGGVSKTNHSYGENDESEASGSGGV